MFSVKKVHYPERKKILGTKMLPAKDRYLVTDEKDDITWDCEMEITAEMYAACKNHDSEHGTHFERELHEYLNGVQNCG